jgi:EF-hand domain pair
LINYTEWVAATLEAHGCIEEDRIAEAFDKIDVDDTGFITKNDLRELLGPDVPVAHIDSIIKTADINRDGKISYEEFVAAFRRETGSFAHRIAAQNDNMDESESNNNGDDHMDINSHIPGGAPETS